MTKVSKMRWCAVALMVAGVAVLASGIWLEVEHGLSVASVWWHLAVACVFMALIAWHIYLHFGWRQWTARFRKQRSVVTKILWWLAIFTFVTGVASTIHWLGTHTHSPLGGVHGKIGFAMIALAVCHTAKRFKFISAIFR